MVYAGCAIIMYTHHEAQATAHPPSDLPEGDHDAWWESFSKCTLYDGYIQIMMICRVTWFLYVCTYMYHMYSYIIDYPLLYIHAWRMHKRDSINAFFHVFPCPLPHAHFVLGLQPCTHPPPYVQVHFKLLVHKYMHKHTYTFWNERVRSHAISK